MSKKKGLKFDGQKPMMALIPPHAELELAKAMTIGMERYGKHNYLNGLEATRLISAAKRHINAFSRGENIDPDSGVHHLAHAAAGVLMMYETLLVKPDMDDRFKYEIRKIDTDKK